MIQSLVGLYRKVEVGGYGVYFPLISNGCDPFQRLQPDANGRDLLPTVPWQLPTVGKLTYDSLSQDRINARIRIGAPTVSFSSSVLRIGKLTCQQLDRPTLIGLNTYVSIEEKQRLVKWVETSILLLSTLSQALLCSEY